MFGKIVYIGESEAHVENLQKDIASSDLMNVNVIFEIAAKMWHYKRRDSYR